MDWGSLAGSAAQAYAGGGSGGGGGGSSYGDLKTSREQSGGNVTSPFGSFTVSTGRSRLSNGEGAAADAFGNPTVLIALGALALVAVVLAKGKR